MNGVCRLNNKSMRNTRRNEVYQTVIIDLMMLGVISKEKAQMLIGGGIPANLCLPDGTNKAVTEEPEEPEDDD